MFIEYDFESHNGWLELTNVNVDVELLEIVHGMRSKDQTLFFKLKHCTAENVMGDFSPANILEIPVLTMLSLKAVMWLELPIMSRLPCI